MRPGHAGSLGRNGAAPGILQVRWEKQKCAVNAECCFNLLL